HRERGPAHVLAPREGDQVRQRRDVSEELLDLLRRLVVVQGRDELDRVAQEPEVLRDLCGCGVVQHAAQPRAGPGVPCHRASDGCPASCGNRDGCVRERVGNGSRTPTEGLPVSITTNELITELNALIRMTEAEAAIARSRTVQARDD